MENKTVNPRIPECEVDSMLFDRWSPRSFLPDPIPEHQIEMLFEAARWAPSCSNEQPWLFMYATSKEEKDRLASALVEKNRQWAARAPLLVFVLARQRFEKNDKENRHAAFDAGAAWMSLALQARKLGLYTHAMAGFNQERAYEVLDVAPKYYLVMAAVAVGRRGTDEQLPEDLRAIEKPNTRKPWSQIAVKIEKKA